MVETSEGLRLLTAPAPGRAREGLCRGSARGDGPGGDVAEDGGDAISRHGLSDVVLRGSHLVELLKHK